MERDFQVFFFIVFEHGAGLGQQDGGCGDTEDADEMERGTVLLLGRGHGPPWVRQRDRGVKHNTCWKNSGLQEEILCLPALLGDQNGGIHERYHRQTETLHHYHFQM